MGWRFRRSTRIGPFRLTAGKTGLGVSFGVKGARLGIGADGRVRSSVGLPGTGISYQKSYSSRSHAARQATPAAQPSIGTGCLNLIVALAIIAGGIALLGKVGNAWGAPGVVAALAIGVAGWISYSLYSGSRARRIAELATLAGEQARQAYAQELVARFGKESAGLILAGDPWQGATQEMIQEMLGPPHDTSKRVYKTKTSETWKYGEIAKNRYRSKIEFENGVCVGWEIA